MQSFLRVVSIVGVCIGLSFSTIVWAESAPVYDADTLQQQFESSGDQGEDLPPPPAPGQERAFVPTPAQAPQAQTSQTPALQVVSQPVVNTSTLTINQRVAQMEQQIDNLQSTLSSTRMEALQKEIQSLRDQVEQLTHQVQQVQNQQKSMYSDLEKKLSQSTNSNKIMKTSPDSDFTTDDVVTTTHKPPRKVNPPKVVADTSSSEAKSLEDQSNVVEEQQVYQTAYNLIKAKKYNEAINSLQTMLQKYPSGQFAANAHYWLGDLYNVTGKNDKALSEFSVVTK